LGCDSPIDRALFLSPQIYLRAFSADSLGKGASPPYKSGFALR
jgi:hypothetical protein